jgi:ornithine carbamoyltransferase
MHKDFLDIIDYTPEELLALLNLARTLKEEYQAGGNQPTLKGKVLALIFQKPSLRTRVSFDMGMRHLGGDALYLSPMRLDWASASPLPTSPGCSRAWYTASWRAS